MKKRLLDVLKWGMIFAALSITISCTHDMPTVAPQTENIIYAPIDVVWERSLQVLKAHKININTANRLDYFISGWSWWSYDITIRLTAHKYEEKTIIYIGVEPWFITKMTVWGHRECVISNFFDKIKSASETTSK